MNQLCFSLKTIEALDFHNNHGQSIVSLNKVYLNYEFWLSNFCNQRDRITSIYTIFYVFHERNTNI